MGINIFRGIFVMLCVLIGSVTYSRYEGIAGISIIGVIIGIIVSAIGIMIEIALKRVPVKYISGAVIGGIIGLSAAYLISTPFNSIFHDNQGIIILVKAFLIGIMTYLGIVIGIKIGSEVRLANLTGIAGSPAATYSTNNKILDTSVIIDGRIADLCETGFMEGVFVIPRFILIELQYIADSSDSLKRARGRRGLDILHRMQKIANIDVNIVDEDFPNIKEVDSKLVALAKDTKAKVITNDLNLNKIAELQGVTVLNINELCNALRPVVLPGETMKVFILKEGKEPGQGVAYLDDGTMIVVDEARRLIGRNVEVIVTSVLQTTAGRMIFTRLKEENDREELHYAKG